ncbi:MAG TPA: signal peptidase II [Candidatus Acidoferrales bacterium]|nr:signal peptidase II [Candidatus Acidoferrales bacterium]
MADSRSIAWRWLILIIAAILAADQATKHAIEKYTSADYLHVVFPGILNLIHTHNPGVAFSLFADSHSPAIRFTLLAFSIAVIIFLFWLLAAERAGGRIGQIGMAMILGGAIGNVFDRLTQRGVTDFIDLHIRSHHWPTFNIADSAIVVGAALVLVELFRDWGHSSNRQGAS